MSTYHCYKTVQFASKEFELASQEDDYSTSPASEFKSRY